MSSLVHNLHSHASPRTCGRCHDDLSPDEREGVTCRKCASVYHAHCAAELGACCASDCGDPLPGGPPELLPAHLRARHVQGVDEERPKLLGALGVLAFCGVMTVGSVWGIWGVLVPSLSRAAEGEKLETWLLIVACGLMAVYFAAGCAVTIHEYVKGVRERPGVVAAGGPPPDAGVGGGR